MLIILLNMVRQPNLLKCCIYSDIFVQSLDVVNLYRVCPSLFPNINLSRWPDACQFLRSCVFIPFLIINYSDGWCGENLYFYPVNNRR